MKSAWSKIFFLKSSWWVEPIVKAFFYCLDMLKQTTIPKQNWFCYRFFFFQKNDKVSLPGLFNLNKNVNIYVNVRGSN